MTPDQFDRRALLSVVAVFLVMLGAIAVNSCSTDEPARLPDCAHLDEGGDVVFGEDCTTEEIERYLIDLERLTPKLRSDRVGSPVSDPTPTPVG